MAKYARVLVWVCFAIFAKVLVTYVCGKTEDYVLPLFTVFTPAPPSEAALGASKGIGSVFDTVVTTSIRNHMYASITGVQAYLYYGRCISVLPHFIKPDNEALLVSHKTTPESFYGVGGLYTFQVTADDGNDLMVAVIFSSPHPLGRVFSNTWFGLAFIKDNSRSLESIYNDLYYSDGWKSAKDDQRFAYASEGRTLVLKDGTVLVTATMQDKECPILQLDVTHRQF